jgi:hypothetical protein
MLNQRSKARVSNSIDLVAYRKPAATALRRIVPASDGLVLAGWGLSRHRGALMSTLDPRMTFAVTNLPNGRRHLL